jgi:hypothetical protein
MSSRIGSRWVLAAAVVCIGSVCWWTQPAASQQVKVVEVPAKWEYNTINLEVGGLEAKLGELGLAGWEVVSINHTETTLAQGGAEPKLIVQKLQVTSKRRMK